MRMYGRIRYDLRKKSNSFSNWPHIIGLICISRDSCCDIGKRNNNSNDIIITR